MSMSIIEKKEIIIQNRDSTLISNYHKDCDTVDIEMVVGTESTSNISISWEEAKVLGKWLLDRALEIKNLSK